MSAETSAIALNVLTGFLGAGKTSLLKRLLASPELAGAAVLINEFGEVGLDHLLLERLDGDVVLLKSGCVCCTIRGDLKSALLDLHGRRARGEVPPFDRVIVETTGLADPAPIAATVVADPMLRNAFRMGNIVAVADAVNALATLAAHAESAAQIAVADRIVLSKTDIASPEDVTALEAMLGALNPAAEIVVPNDDDASLASLILADVQGAETRASEVARWLRAAPVVHDGAHRHGAIGAFMLEADAPLDGARFGLWLAMLLNRHGGSILRLKGLLHIDGVPTPIVVQGVQHLVHAPSHLAAWPDGRPRTTLVVIARDVDPALVVRSFRAVNRSGHSGSVARTA